MKKDKEKKLIQSLKRMFTISVAALECMSAISHAFNPTQIKEPSLMHSLHMIALTEVSKKKPDMNVIYELLSDMEKLAEEYKLNEGA